MKKLHVKWNVLTLASVLVIFLCSPALALPILDQSQTQYDGGVAFWSDRPLVQTFTAGLNGTLEQLSLSLGGSPISWSDPIPIHIEIIEWASSEPGATLGQIDTSIIATQTNSWMDFDLLSQNISLSSGTIYGIMLSNDLSLPDPYRNTGIAVQWDTNPYNGGGLWSYTGTDWTPWPYGDTNTDAAFQTWISDAAPVPEPATIFLLGPGLVGLVGFGRKKFLKK